MTTESRPAPAAVPDPAVGPDAAAEPAPPAADVTASSVSPTSLPPTDGVAPSASAQTAAEHPAEPGYVSAADQDRLRLHSLVHLARAMADPRPTDEMIEVAAQEIRFAVGAAAVSVSRLERESGLLRTLRNVGELAGWQVLRPADETHQIADHPASAALVEEAQPFVHDALDPDADPWTTEQVLSIGKRHALAVPVLLDGRVWGKLLATRGHDAPPFSDEDLAIVEALTAVMAAGIGQASRVSLVERLAYQDPLTGLANRRAVDLRLEEALDARNAGGGPVSVVMADVNGLKLANDAHGHEAGDRILVAVANAISLGVSPVEHGLAGRIGGDEFCVVLAGLAGEDAVRLAQAVMDRLGEGPHAGALSCGVASTSLVADSSPVSARQILRWADEAQYTAKRAGLQVPVLAGRDTLAQQPIERRTVRGAPGDGSNASFQQVLTSGLDVLATSVGDDPQLRLVRMLDAACDATGASGWVLSRCEGDGSRTVAFAQSGESGRPEESVDLRGSWFERASRTGSLDRVDALSHGPAATRGVAVVAAAASADWLLELLGDDHSLTPGTAAALRALTSVAVHG